MRISDWRSDVCSSDLMGIDAHARTTGRLEALHRARRRHEGVGIFGVDAALDRVAAAHDVFLPDRQLLAAGDQQLLAHRSEERRVGEEWVSRWSSWWSAHDSKKKNTIGKS